MHESRDTARIIRAWMETFMTRSMRDSRRFAKKTGLSMPRFGLLLRLYHGGECGVHEVGRHFDISGAAASQLVDKLVQAGLAVRTENPDDRRARHIGLTAKGRAIIDRGTEESYRWINEFVAELTQEQKAAVCALLPALIEAEGRLPRREERSAIEAIRPPR